MKISAQIPVYGTITESEGKKFFQVGSLGVEVVSEAKTFFERFFSALKKMFLGPFRPIQHRLHVIVHNQPKVVEITPRSAKELLKTSSTKRASESVGRAVAHIFATEGVRRLLAQYKAASKKIDAARASETIQLTKDFSFASLETLLCYLEIPQKTREMVSSNSAGTAASLPKGLVQKIEQAFAKFKVAV